MVIESSRDHNIAIIFGIDLLHIPLHSGNMRMEKDVYWLRVQIYGFSNLLLSHDAISIDFPPMVLKYFLGTVQESLYKVIESLWLEIIFPAHIRQLYDPTYHLNGDLRFFFWGVPCLMPFSKSGTTWIIINFAICPEMR